MRINFYQKKITNQLNQSAIRTVSQRLYYFSRCGNKEKIEVYFRKFINKRALIYQNSITSSNHKIVKVNVLFNSYFHAAMPFVNLKLQIKNVRSKILNSKIFPLSVRDSERKSIKNLSIRLRKVGPQAFTERLNSVLENLINVSRKNVVQTSNLNLREKRDLLHRTAFSVIPSIWKNLILNKNKLI